VISFKTKKKSWNFSLSVDWYLLETISHYYFNLLLRFLVIREKLNNLEANCTNSVLINGIVGKKLVLIDNFQ